MLKLTAALCLSVILTITTTGRPAHAEDQVLGQLLFGAVAAGIAYQLLRDRDDGPQAVAPPPRVSKQAPPRAKALRDRPRQSFSSTQDWTGRDKRRACRQILPTRRGDVRFISDRCVTHPRAKPRVPQACLRSRRVRGQTQQVYSRRCLAQYGQVR